MTLRALTFAACLALPLAAQALELKSESFNDGEPLKPAQVFKGFGCEGENLSPQLTWIGVPQAAKSLAITVYDPDAPTGSGWWHWVAFNLPVNSVGLKEGASGKEMPEGAIETRSDYGTPGFGGACPPQGDKPHRYIVTVFALDIDSLPLKADATPAMVGYFLNQHALEKASLTGRYGR